MYATTFESLFFKCSTPQASVAFTFGNASVVFSVRVFAVERGLQCLQCLVRSAREVRLPFFR